MGLGASILGEGVAARLRKLAFLGLGLLLAAEVIVAVFFAARRRNPRCLLVLAAGSFG